MIKTRQEITDLCLSFENCYDDRPFHDPNWCVIRHNENNKVFAWIFFRNGNMWINLKCSKEKINMVRQQFDSVLPAYHLNKEHWNSVILDGTVPDDDIFNMIKESYLLTLNKPKRR
ncbi:MAG: MmcQ/YjbR family DNA-binding protein [Ruminococcus callidus]|nr:MmcQ/YjbR family DNA-binding protein [Ruminococcus callidus]